MDTTVVIAQSLDAFITEQEFALSSNHHVEDTVGCEFRLGRGQPLSKKICSMCSRLSPLIDLSTSWTQRVDFGSLGGRSIEVVEIPSIRTIKDAEDTWKIYRSCDNKQRERRQCLLRRYYASFTCAGRHYVLRDVTAPSPSVLPPIVVMMAQLIEFVSEGLPETFIHGNPTVTSISFLGKLPIPLKHKVFGDFVYGSRSLIQVDFGGVDSTATTKLATKGGSLLGEESLGAIVVDAEKGTLTVRAEASFTSFLREYPRHSRIITLHLLMRGLFFLYRDVAETTMQEYVDAFPHRGSGCKNLREAFEELRGRSIPLDLASLLEERLRRQLVVS